MAEAEKGVLRLHPQQQIAHCQHMSHLDCLQGREFVSLPQPWLVEKFWFKAVRRDDHDGDVRAGVEEYSAPQASVLRTT